MRNENFFNKISSFFSNFIEQTTNVNKVYPKTLDDIMKDKISFTYEEHTITTSDNIHLKLIHIIKKENLQKKRYPILFIHGILDSSDSWLINNIKSNLPLILSNLNFDIWLLNCRGNKYSKMLENQNIISDNSNYWNFSFHEIGIYDIPSTINFISLYNSNKLFLICHSQGCTATLAGICENNALYKSKTCGIIFLAPPSRVDNTNCSKIINILNSINFWDILQSNEILGYDPTLSSLNAKANDIYPTGYLAVLETFSDSTLTSISKDTLSKFLSVFPSGTSRQSMMHFKQIYDSKEFQKFDYGEEENKIRYGAAKPPKYSFEAVEGLRVILVGGKEDELVSIKDVRWLKGILGKQNVLYGYHELDFMGHLSFLLNDSIIWFNPILREMYRIIDSLE